MNELLIDDSQTYAERMVHLSLEPENDADSYTLRVVSMGLSDAQVLDMLLEAASELAEMMEEDEDDDSND
jgi:hypothetical protein